MIRNARRLALALLIVLLGLSPAAALAEYCWVYDPDLGRWSYVWHEVDFPDYDAHWNDHQSEFPEYSNKEIYKQEAQRIIRRKEDGDMSIEKCAARDARTIYFLARDLLTGEGPRSEIVIVHEATAYLSANIGTYLVPPGGRNRYIDLCNEPT